MKRLAVLLSPLPLLSFVCLTVLAQNPDQNQPRSAFACLEVAKNMSIAEIHAEIKQRLSNPKSPDAFFDCETAELMKRVGDSRALEYYEKAIDTDDAEPAYELFLADYLRNFRGAQRPLFPQAEQHYFAALRKLKQIKEPQAWDSESQSRVERGTVALYQEDGLPLLYRESDMVDGEHSIERPYMFFSTIYRNASSTTDTQAVDDVRAFTSEALFASSVQRLNRSLTSDELSAIARAKDQFETLNRVRFRYKAWPALDFFYNHREIDGAQITNFFLPKGFNDFQLNEYGVAVEKPFSVSSFDFWTRARYSRVERKGLVEFNPNEKESVNQIEATIAVARFFGPDKAILEATYVFQDINSDQSNPPKRNRQIVAATITYQIFRPIRFLQKVYGQHFGTRGLHLFGGYANDRERFGDVVIKKEDFFVGSSLRGLGGFDFTVQPTFFKVRVDSDKSQTSSQYRTNATVLYRILDEEESPGIPGEHLELHPKFLGKIPGKILGLHPAFVHIVVPFRHDVAMSGLKAFENVNVGIGLDAKFFTAASRRTTFLTSFRYNHESFYKLNKTLNLFYVSLGMGF